MEESFLTVWKNIKKCQEMYNAPFPEEIVQYLMKQIVSALRYLHAKRILHRDINLNNILIHYEKEEDKLKRNLMKAKVKLIDFGFARYLKTEEFAYSPLYSTLGKEIILDPSILKKLKKMENFKDYGYDEKADIWSLGIACYEMLIGNSPFVGESIKEFVLKVERGDYFLPSTLSKEAASFLIGMLEDDSKKRLTAEDLYSHIFLKGNFKDFHKINLKEVNKNLATDSKIKINTNIYQSVWNIDYFTCSGFGPPKQPKFKNGNNLFKIKEKEKEKEEALKKEFLKAFEIINDDYIYFEPKLLPIIPGDDPTVINKVSEYNVDNF